MHGDKRRINYTPFMDFGHGGQHINLLADWLDIVCFFVCFEMAEVIMQVKLNPHLNHTGYNRTLKT